MIYDQIPDGKKFDYLKELLDYVVEKNGLASVPKQDMEACFVYLYKKHVDQNIDIYNLSKIFKIKESKLKSLMELFYLKFNDNDSRSDDEKFIDLIIDTQFEIESFEKVQISFHFNKIEAFQLLQEYFRRCKGSVKFDKIAESVIVNQNRLYDVLDMIWDHEKEKSVEESDLENKIQKIIGNIGNSIDEEMRKKLREKKQSKFHQSIEYASHLAGIGSLIITLYKSAPFNLLS
jgi:hypothetical protein